MSDATDEQVNEMRSLLLDSYNKNPIPYFKVSPLYLMKEHNIEWEFISIPGRRFTHENFPDNLIYNEEMIFSDDLFYASQHNDTTLWYFVNSSLGRLKSILSRAVNNKDKKYEHSPILSYFIEGKSPKHYQVRSCTFISFREI